MLDSTFDNPHFRYVSFRHYSVILSKIPVYFADRDSESWKKAVTSEVISHVQLS